VSIDTATVNKIARLARLELDPEAVETIREQLESILDYVAMLDELDLSETLPTAQTVTPDQPLREDRPSPCPGSEQATSNAPDAAENMFRVPRVLQG